MYPVLVCIAKREQSYIREFIAYHLALGFKKIYLYDNEDEPCYESFLNNKNVIVHHLPFNHYEKAIQYMALDHFATVKDPITHVAHIDIDEFIVLKKHRTIQEFIEEYITGTTVGIGMNWRFFGSHESSTSGVTQRFTMCEKDGNKHIKTLYRRDCFLMYKTVHDIITTKGFIKSTNGKIIRGPFNEDIDFNVIQLNHYKCKTLLEFKYIRERQRADLKGDQNENVEESFQLYDKNEVEELTAKQFYESITLTDFLNHRGFHVFEGCSQNIPEQVQDLIRLSKNCLNIMEIGFNAGHSALTFLKHTNAKITSFDLGEHDYVNVAKEYIDMKYPNRHTLILGDSRDTVPHCKDTFDLIFIDGGHDYEVAKVDMKNCLLLAKPNAMFIMDDTVYTQGWHFPYTLGPTRAWMEENTIHKIGRKDYGPGRGMSWGTKV